MVEVQQQLLAWLKEYRSPLLSSWDTKQQELRGQSHQIIATARADEFIVALGAGIATGIPTFLANPAWGEVEWQQVQALTAAVDPSQHRGQIMIPTGGTSGQIKFAIHTPETLTTAAQGFQQFFRVPAVHSYCTLPLHHVSGLMQWWRSLITNGQFYQVVEKFNEQPVANGFISLVPTQLQRLLAKDVDWLRSFQAVLVGGAPTWPDLLTQARLARIPIALSYGMTETAAMVTALPPAEFWAGAESSGRALPHAQVRLTADGQVAINSSALMLGYYPQVSPRGVDYVTDDLGVLDDQGYLTLWGRESHKIISGGEKVWPPEVEAVIRSTGLVEDVYVLGIPDPEWGERVVAVYVGSEEVRMLQTAIQGQLSKFKQPKTWVAVPQIPRNSQGKIDRATILTWVKAAVSGFWC